MPLVRMGHRLIYFAHVPKCAGTAVERYLVERFGPLAFHDPKFGTIDPDARWSRTSPQHMPEATRLRILPDAFLDGIFTTVRHPVRRLRSVFLFQREVEGRIAADTDFSAWIKEIPGLLEDDPHIFDGHLKPMGDTVPEHATVFRVEDGLEQVVAWIDRHAGTETGPRKIKAANVLSARMAHAKRDVPDVAVTAQDRRVIRQIYRDDFERFGY